MTGSSPEHEQSLDAWIERATADLTRGARKRLREEYLDHYQEAFGKAMESGDSEDDAHGKAMEALGESAAAQRASFLIHADPYRLRVKMMLVTLGAILISASWYYTTTVRLVFPYDMDGLDQALKRGRQEIALGILDIAKDSDAWGIVGGQPVLEMVLKYPTKHSADLFRILLERGANPEYSSPGSPNTLVHQLVNRGHVNPDEITGHLYPETYQGDWDYFHAQRFEIVNILIEAGVDLDVASENGWTPMTFAAYEGDTEMVDRLREQGIRESPEALAYSGDFDELRKRISENPALLHERYANDATLFLISVSRAPLSFLTFLVDSGADPAARDNQGRNALHRAVYGYGRSTNLTRYRARRCIPCPEKQMENIQKSDKDIAEIIQFLIDQGLDVNRKCAYSKPSGPLHFAAQFGLVDTIEVLLDNGAEIDLLDERGFTPLLIAAGQRDPSTALFLIDRGANIRHRSFSELTALHFANTDEMFSLAQRLIDDGADVNTRSLFGKTPLLNARSMEVVMMLIRAGADINARDSNGNNILDIVAAGYFDDYSKTLTYLTMLLAHGADPTNQNIDGRTAYENARMYGNYEIADLLSAAAEAYAAP